MGITRALESLNMAVDHAFVDLTKGVECDGRKSFKKDIIKPYCYSKLVA